MSISTNVTTGSIQFLKDPRFLTNDFHLYLDRHNVAVIDYNAGKYTNFAENYQASVADHEMRIDYFIEAQILIFTDSYSSENPIENRLVYLAYS